MTETPQPSRIRRALDTITIRREARRRLRALHRQRRGPWVRVELGLRGDEWTDVKGLTGVKDTVPLTRDGLRVTVRRWTDIRRSCLRLLEDDVRRERDARALSAKEA